jgi:uncharacterized membrane protein YqjE
VPPPLPRAVSLSPSAPGTAEALGSASTGDLVRSTLEESKELVRIELMLMQEELREDVSRLKTVAILGGAALVLALITLSTLVVALVLALGGDAGVALGIACALAALTVVLGAIAAKVFPGAPLEKTRARLQQDAKQIKEHVA